MDYNTFKVLLDEPAALPSLGYPTYAGALAEIVTTSQPQFAIGIFGGWGSGKTTLMRAIDSRLKAQPDVITVWFNAWRFEREGNMIVPLVDVLRQALSQYAEQGAEPARRAKAKAAADRIARAGWALLAGIRLKAAVPGLTAEVEPSRIIEAYRGALPGDSFNEPLSFYQVGFTMLEDAIREFIGYGADRIVIFIDDLDRCLPTKALEVLESMKVFFDTKGVVFVVGLDRTVVENAVSSKFRGPDADAAAIVDGTEYLKKIFQVPFALPRIATSMLSEYLDHIAASGELSPEQEDDFKKNMRPHLAFLTGDDSVNPREVKRLINAYTIQLKMLGARLQDFDPNVVLALQCMSFRPDWEALYEHLVSDPALFQRAIRDARTSQPAAETVWLAGERVSLPASFRAYLDGRGGALMTVPTLEQYVAAVEATRSADPSILEAHVVVARLRREIERLPEVDLSWDQDSDLIDPPSIDDEISRFMEAAERALMRYPDQLTAEAAQLASLKREFPKRRRTQDPEEYRREIARWAERTLPVLDAIDSGLRELRRRATVGASYES